MSRGQSGQADRQTKRQTGIPAQSSRVDALIGSLEHAVAGVGGFCAGRRPRRKGKKGSKKGNTERGSCVSHSYLQPGYTSPSQLMDPDMTRMVFHHSPLRSCISPKILAHPGSALHAMA